MIRKCGRFLLSFQVVVMASALRAADPKSAAVPSVPLQVADVEPVRFERRDGIYFVDFGQDAYGSLRMNFLDDMPTGELKVRLGEKLNIAGAIDRNPGGSVSYREVSLLTQSGKTNYQLQIPAKKLPKGNISKAIPGVGEIAPFRYAEIEGVSSNFGTADVRQLFVHAPFDDAASRFESSDKTLNAVWDLCKHTMKATTAFGIYIDGDRERTPYEADAYINQLSHYACDLDPRVARRTFEYLLAHPTWPTEWSFHMPMIAAEDYMATGDIRLAKDHYDALVKKLMMEKAREDGLLQASAVVDWPPAERDGYNDGAVDPDQKKQAGPKVNTVANAFYFHALKQMGLLARALNKENDAHQFEMKAKQVYESFNRVFFDKMRGVYTDGEGNMHSSLHANMFPLAFDLVPDERKVKVADFVQSRGMACSVYGAQYLLEALFEAGRDTDAVQLMTAKTERSWSHMMDLGSTMTLEAWDAKFKSNLTWNHAWGSAPANILSRFVLGVRPITPGYTEMLIAPQLGTLKWVSGQVPTPLGAAAVNAASGDVSKIEVNIPHGAKARVLLPARAVRQIMLDGKPVAATLEGAMFSVGPIASGTHVIESR